MKEWLQSFAEPSFMPHGHCYLWRPHILWTHVVSDAVVALAYYAIPVILGILLVKQKRLIVYPEIIALFVAFIFLCGSTHLMSIYVTWNPVYEPQGWLKALTALISITTAVVLIPKLPKLVAMPGVQAAYVQSQNTIDNLEKEKEDMESMFRVVENREFRIIELKQEVNRLLLDNNKATKYRLDNTGS